MYLIANKCRPHASGLHKLLHVCICCRVGLKPVNVVAAEVQPTQESGSAEQPRHVDAAGGTHSAAQYRLLALAQLTAHGC